MDAARLQAEAQDVEKRIELLRQRLEQLRRHQAALPRKNRRLLIEIGENLLEILSEELAEKRGQLAELVAAIGPQGHALPVIDAGPAALEAPPAELSQSSS